jgi:uncharacterized protein YegP (UPF0339 family)
MHDSFSFDIYIDKQKRNTKEIKLKAKNDEIILSRTLTRERQKG